MAKKIVEEVKTLEVEIVAKVKTAFHTVCTKFGNILFKDGKAVVSAESKDLIDELQSMNVVEEVKPVTPATAPGPEPTPVPEQPKSDGK